MKAEDVTPGQNKCSSFSVMITAASERPMIPGSGMSHTRPAAPPGLRENGCCLGRGAWLHGMVARPGRHVSADGSQRMCSSRVNTPFAADRYHMRLCARENAPLNRAGRG